MGGVALADACAACRWALSAREWLRGEGRVGKEVYSTVRSATRGALRRTNPRQLRVVPTKAGILCLLPQRRKPGRVSATSVRGEALLAAAELLADGSLDGKSDTALATALFAGATYAGSVAAWPVELHVRWLTVAARCPPTGGLAEGAGRLMAGLGELRPATLVTHAATCYPALPAIAAAGAHEDSAAFAALLTSAVRREHFRLSLREACSVLDAGCALLEALPKAATLRGEVRQLAATAVQGLPAKFNSARIFRRNEGVSEADVLAWCELLASARFRNAACTECEDSSTEEMAMSTEDVLEDLWLHLAGEVVQLVNKGEPDATTAAMLRAFVEEGERRDWSALDEASPLGTVSVAVAAEWRRAIACDGELEAVWHEPLPIPDAAEAELRRLFARIGLDVPAAGEPQQPPPM
eukprot:NODE_7752_length_1553_cov_5.307854.p1 GENE.NODE_7752_length_1553_cov_5.307854~~NODE_7752_length_1553_cov_5.307854.p1  ORF type:complete len:412 (-),score=139.57 NODE_7752_length_1553_cov_5.307854:82-1317(-)